MSLDSVVFGQEFRRAFKNLPAPWFIDNMLLPLARKISPSLRFGSLDAPYMMTPLVTASQIVHVAVSMEWCLGIVLAVAVRCCTMHMPYQTVWQSSGLLTTEREGVIVRHARSTSLRKPGDACSRQHAWPAPK